MFLVNIGQTYKIFALSLIIFSAIGLRIFVASDHYLHTWDERYHALVAKNMVSEPLEPTLYKTPLLPYSMENWVANHVWLEKGPVPLWSMACSIKLFGENEYAIRIPSLIISVLAVWLTFLMGKNLFDEKTGLLAAFFHSINGLLIEVAGGRISSDHIETFFIFFIQLAAFLVILTIKNRKVTFLSLLIGMVTGIAFLCKWTPSVVIFPLWMIGEYFNSNKTKARIFYNLSLGIFGFALIITPWLIYINEHFPEEAHYVFKKFLFAYNQTVEQHTGPFYHYFQNLGMVYGELIWIPIIWTIYKSKFDWKLIFLNCWWIIPFVIFSFAATKRHTYLLMCAPALFLLESNFIFKIIENHQRKRITIRVLIALLILLPVRYSIERVKPFKNSVKEPVWRTELINMRGKFDEKTVFMNYEHAIEGMFYTDYIFYDRLPLDGEIESLAQKGYKVIIKP